MFEIKLGGDVFLMSVVYKRKRHLSFRWKDDTVIVYAPNSMSLATVKQLVLANQDRLLKLRQKTMTARQLEDNQCYFLGKVYTIQENPMIQDPFIAESSIQVPNITRFKDTYVVFLQQEAASYIPLRVRKITSQTEMFDKFSQVPIEIKAVKSYWGKCFSRPLRLIFNCHLMKYSVQTIDAVIYHELTHFYHMNHSKAFYDRLISVYPSYKQDIKHLKNKY